MTGTSRALLRACIAFLLAVGVSDVAGAFTTSFPLPPQLPSGWQFGVQAVVPWSSGSLRLSNVRIGWIGAD